MKKLLLLLLTFTCVFTQAQLNFYVEPSFNISLISGSQATQIKEVPSNQTNSKMFQRANYSAAYNNNIGGGVTVGLNYFFQENFSFDAAIDVNNANFQQTLRTKTVYLYESKTDFKITEATHPAPSETEKSDNHSLLLISLPVSISYYLLENDLSVGVGFVPSLLLYGSGGSGLSSDFNKFHTGVQVKLAYQVAPKWWITSTFQEYGTKLYTPELKQSFSNLRALRMGVKYEL